MSKVNIERKAKLVEKDKITIDSQVHEDVSPEEYVQLYSRKAQEVYQLKETVSQGKEQLKEIDGETSEEIEKFKELLIKAENLRKKEELVKNLREMEIQLQNKEKELESLTPVMKEINKQNGSREVSKAKQ